MAGAAVTTVILAFGFAYAQQGPRGKSSYMQVDINEPLSAIFARLSGHKPDVMGRLRRKIDGPYPQPMIYNVRGKGFIFGIEDGQSALG
jgi:hypothetical protein